jgi:hypothetical protein
VKPTSLSSNKLTLFQPLPQLHKELTQSGGRILNPTDLEASPDLTDETTAVMAPSEGDPVSIL